MMATCKCVFLILSVLIFELVQCNIRVNSYQNSVYIGYTNTLSRGYPLKLFKDSLIFDPDFFDFTLVDDEAEYMVEDKEDPQKGHAVKFYKFVPEGYGLRESQVMTLFITDENYYKVIKRTLIQKLAQ